MPELHSLFKTNRKGKLRQRGSSHKMKQKHKSIISYQADMSAEAQSELKIADGQAEFTPLDSETALVSTVPDFSKLSRIFTKQPPVFIRHIHPVDTEIPLDGTGADTDLLVQAAESLEISSPGRFSVQCRILHKNQNSYTPFDINTALSRVLQQRGGTEDVKAPDNVLSVTVCDGRAYMGWSSVRDNLSSWAGGRIRFRREEEQLSRAEFKLLEAESTFGLDFFKGARVLDLGAAPGGWSRIMLLRGCSVVAVDPAELDPSVLSKSGITHIKMTAQEYLNDPEYNFDFILNDMRMAPDESAALINRLHPCLKNGGTVVLTLKLSGDKPRRQMLKAVSLLENYYSVLHIRQLFHNRSEVTVLLRK